MNATAHDAAELAAQRQAEAIRDAKLWYWQRLSAMVLAVCVFVHLGTMIYAVRGGLTAAEILGRTKGNWLWGAFYLVFVLAAAIHVPLGLRAIINEWFGWRGRLPMQVIVLIGVCYSMLGFAAIWGLVR